MTTEPTKTIAIIDGVSPGSAGTLARVIVINQRPGFGLGLTYSTPSLDHLLNTPAGKISALPDH
jgi:uncharacterized NAD(P)/FAD-binding protein YdhS